MKIFGLIGYPLSHSRSAEYFSVLVKNPEYSYRLFPLKDIQDIKQLIYQNPGLVGLNVTIPYKEKIIPYLDELDPGSRKIGAVNTIRISRKDNIVHLKGFNTDAYGFAESLKPLLEKQHQKALIFGDGGAAKAVKYVLKQLDIPYEVVVRKHSPNTLHYDEVTKDILDEYKLLINTTPLGMSPNLESSVPIPYQHLTNQHLAYDLVYNPEETVFLSKAKEQRAKIKNGLEMLYLQAERSWYIWNA